MADIRERGDGQFELVLPSGRVAIGEHRASLERLAAEYDWASESAIAFLQAWKAGVRLAGEGFFKVKSATVAEALDKNDLRPDRETVEGATDLSHGQRVFLHAMYSFFNDQRGSELFARHGETGNPAEMASILDGERRRVIAELLIHYRGW